MSLSFSRSVKFGAVRFNFSTAGIGISLGVPGLRVGIGARGAYIGGGVGGFRYRKSLNAQPQGKSQPIVAPKRVDAPQGSDDFNVIARVEHETTSVLELSDSTSDALLQSMNEQFSKVPLWPFVCVGLLVLFSLFVVVSGAWPAFLRPVVFVTFVAIAGWVYWRDQMGKLTVLFYEPDQVANDLFDCLCRELKQAATARKIKSIASTSQYADKKYSAGAGQGLRFGGARLVLGHAPGVVANVPVPVLTSDKTTLAFYPDRVLAFQGKAVGAIEYAKLSAESERVKYVESESVPGDAQVVDKTWQYVNKKGGPDRRFKNNRELPICAYSQLNISTPDGLDVRFIGSKNGGFDGLAHALSAMHAAFRRSHISGSGGVDSAARLPAKTADDQ